MSSREEKFKRLANTRVNKTLKQIELIGNLSNKSIYQYTDADVAKIFREIDGAIRISKSRFKTKNNKKRFEL